MSGVSRPEVKAVYVLVEYADGVESYEMMNPFAVGFEAVYSEHRYGWGDLRIAPTFPERITFTVTPGRASPIWLKLVRFEKKPGRSLIWALRKLLGASQ